MHPSSHDTSETFAPLPSSSKSLFVNLSILGVVFAILVLFMLTTSKHLNDFKSQVMGEVDTLRSALKQTNLRYERSIAHLAKGIEIVEEIMKSKHPELFSD
jgi:hypothetical protein